MSSAVTVAPLDSNGEAGTQLDIITNTSSGTASALRSIARTPSTPNTLAISCGSRTTVVVPHGIAARANWSIVSLVDSRCMWPSTNPRGRIHQVAFFVSIPAGVVLVLLAHGPAATTVAAVYAASLAAVFGSSAAYHRGRWTERARRWMKRLDHSMIFVLI